MSAEIPENEMRSRAQRMPGKVPPSVVPPGAVPPGAPPLGPVPPNAVPLGAVPPEVPPLGADLPNTVPPGAPPLGAVPPNAIQPSPARPGTEDGESGNLIVDAVSKLDTLVGNATGLERLRGFSWGRFFSAVLRPHSDDELYDIFQCGTPKTTPGLSGVNAEWPTPWVFTRVLVYGLLLSLLFGWGAMSMGNINFYPVLIMTVATTVPFAVLILLFELNVWRDISMLNILRAFLGGGAVSLVLTLVLHIFLPHFMSSGACWAGPVEETAKLIAVLIVLARAKLKLNHILHGILLGGAVGAGFASFETAGYVARYFLGSFILNVGVISRANDTMVSVALTRGVLAPFCHVVWTAIATGVLCRVILMRRAEQTDVSGEKHADLSALFDKRFLRLFLIPILLHFSWNGSGSLLAAMNLKGEAFEVIHYVVLGVLGLLAWMVLLRLIQEGISGAQRAKLIAAAQATPPSQG